MLWWIHELPGIVGDTVPYILGFFFVMGLWANTMFVPKKVDE